MKYTVQAVAFGKDYSGKFGAMKIYRVKFSQSPETVDVTLAAKTPPPNPGDEMDGTIEQGKFGYWFKKTPQQRPSSQKPLPEDRMNAMFVSYAKDLLISYLNFVAWDMDSINEDNFMKAVDLVRRSTDRLQNDPPKKEEPKDEIFDPFATDFNL